MYSARNYFVLVTCLLYATQMCESEYILSINASSTNQHLRHFWASTGFCPPAPRSAVAGYFLSEDVKTNIALISSLPNRAIKQVRVHWLLDLVTIRYFDANAPVFNFTNLDLLLDWIHLHGLRPGFELMGNPSSYFNNFLNLKQQQEWQLLVRELAERYTIRYGRKYVSRWRFETWNEPDLRGYNVLNLTLPDYLRYVQACYAGLRTVAKSFKLGGPAGLFKSPDKHPLCWGLVSECGKSQYCPLHFISFHKKGDGTASGVLNGGLELVNYIHTQFPRLKHLPIANDEADILSGWSKSQEWRADVRYAAMVVKVIIDHYETFVRDLGVNIKVLSNDNGFLNYHPYYFTQRTLLARFQMNNTNPVHVQFFKKPVLAAMALLSYLGNRALNRPVKNEESLFSFLATATTAPPGALSSEKNVYEFAVILSFVNDTEEDKNFTKTFDISIINLPGAYMYKYVMYTLDNVRTNPYSVWQRHDAPVFPDADVRAEIRQVEVGESEDMIHVRRSSGVQDRNDKLPECTDCCMCAKLKMTLWFVRCTGMFPITQRANHSIYGCEFRVSISRLILSMFIQLLWYLYIMWIVHSVQSLPSKMKIFFRYLRSFSHLIQVVEVNITLALACVYSKRISNILNRLSLIPNDKMSVKQLSKICTGVVVFVILVVVVQIVANFILSSLPFFILTDYIGCNVGFLIIAFFPLFQYSQLCVIMMLILHISSKFDSLAVRTETYLKWLIEKHRTNISSKTDNTMNVKHQFIEDVTRHLEEFNNQYIEVHECLNETVSSVRCQLLFSLSVNLTILIFNLYRMLTASNHEFSLYILILAIFVFSLATIRLLMYVYIGHIIQSKSEEPLAALQNAEMLKLPEYIQIRLRTLILQWTPRDPVYFSAFDIIRIGPWLLGPVTANVITYLIICLQYDTK